MEAKSTLSKLENGRAEFAYNCLLEVVKQSDKTKKEYRSYSRKIPTMILNNGLGQTLAFIFSKKDSKNGKNAYELLWSHLYHYLKSRNLTNLNYPKVEEELLKWVISLNTLEYRYVTEEILSFLKWIKRFAEGMIESEEN